MTGNFELAVNHPGLILADYLAPFAAIAILLRYKCIKRAVDIVLAAAGLILSLPLILIFGGTIKLLSRQGPVIYAQKRVGKNGKIFTMLKLRTMPPDAEIHTGAVWCGARDARLIPVIGGFLRRTHLDELPQLLNVLRGDMSIVGPRPERPEIVRRIAPQVSDYYVRLSVRPGITGLAQIRHRYDRSIDDVRKKVTFDIYYIRSISWRMEMRIIIETIGKMLRGKIIT